MNTPQYVHNNNIGSIDSNNYRDDMLKTDPDKQWSVSGSDVDCSGSDLKVYILGDDDWCFTATSLHMEW